MFDRCLVLTLALAALGLAASGPAEAQISGRVIIEEGPIGVDVVFGPRPSVVVEYGSRRPHYEPRPRYEPRRPVRYHRGMTLAELESYRAWIEEEYRFFRRLHPDDAYYHFGWSERELDAYVDWLEDERKSLKKEHKRLRKLLRDRARWGGGHPGRGGDDWEDYWEDYEDDWEDYWEDYEDDREDRRDRVRDAREREREGRGRGPRGRGRG